LGDYFAYLPHGRISVALASVLLGIVFYGLFLFSETYQYSIMWKCMFHLTGGWTRAAALRPMCIDLAKNQSKMAQIVAAWVLLEKTSSAVFGAPLVDFQTKRLFDENSVSLNAEKAQVLAMNMFLLSTFFWGICAYFFVLMGKAEKKRTWQDERKHKRYNHQANDIV